LLTEWPKGYAEGVVKMGGNHKCAPSVHLNVLQQVWDVLDPDSDGNLKESASDLVCISIYEAAIVGKESPKTLKLRGCIHNV
jgi:hypothetical protein